MSDVHVQGPAVQQNHLIDETQPTTLHYSGNAELTYSYRTIGIAGVASDAWLSMYCDLHSNMK